MCPHYGVLTVIVRSGVLQGVHLRPRVSTAQARTGFRLRRQYHTDWWAWDFWSVYRVSVHFLKQNEVLRDRRRMVLEDQNVSLRGRCKESDTLRKSWQAPYFVDIAKTFAGVRRSKDCVLRGRRRDFTNFNLTMLLRFARFESPDLQFSRDLQFSKKSPRKSENAPFHFSKVWLLICGGGLAENVTFGRTPLQEGYRSHRFKNVTHVTASRMLPRSSFQECVHSHRFKLATAGAASRRLPESPVEECYRGLVSRTLPQSSLQECCCSHCFKQVTAVITSRIEECDRRRRFKNASEVTVS